MSDELKERNILKLILIVRFACATLNMGHPICKSYRKWEREGIVASLNLFDQKIRLMSSKYVHHMNHIKSWAEKELI
jgi:hypothetical protein